MKNRSQLFQCAIADKIVHITLRHGGGLQEPANVYVRCDERDCQYVDLNVPPCPLKVEMFADGSDRLVAEHLGAHAGAQLCYACLTETLGITHDQVRRASWRLKDEPGVAIRSSRCVGCRRRRVTIGLGRGAAVPRILAVASESTKSEAAGIDVGRSIASHLRAHAGYSFCTHCLGREVNHSPAVVRDGMWSLEPNPEFPIRTAQCVSCLLVKRVIRYEASPPEADAPRRVLQFLVQSPGIASCPSCLAFSTDLPLGEIRRTLSALETVPEFDRREGPCGVCGRWQPVISFRAGEATHAARLADVGGLVSGHLRHRGARIDLRSFRVAEGWWPLALVRTGTGAHVPDAPAILMSLMATKAEADELAAAQARAWIDKNSP